MLNIEIKEDNVKRRRQVYRYLLVAIVISSLILFVTSCSFVPGADEVLNISVAVIGPFSGDLSGLGQSMRNGIVLATEEQNALGGVLGKQIQLGLYDSGCDYNKAREVTLQAIREMGANYVLGAVCGDASEGVAQIASDEGVLVLNPASVAEGLTLDHEGEVRHYVYRIPFVDSQQGTAAALVALNKLNVKSASILVADTGVYESTLADAFVETFTENGGEVLTRKAYDRTAESYYDIFSELREINAEVIYVPGYYDVINKLAAQARLYGMNQLFLGSDGWDSPDLNKTFLEGCYYTSHFFVNEPRAIVLDWLKKYENRYLIIPDTVATLSYDAANILFTAIERSGTSAPFELASAIQDMTFDAVTGQIIFDDMHNPVKPVIILRIQNGSIVYDSRIQFNEAPEQEEVPE